MIQRVVRVLITLLYLVAGIAHIRDPEPFLRITPGLVPYPEMVVFLTGVAEIAGALALAQPFSTRLRRAAGIALALYALAVWPANINHMMMDLARADGGWGLAYHLPRMAAQPLLIIATLWCADSWPFGVRSKKRARCMIHRAPSQ